MTKPQERTLQETSILKTLLILFITSTSIASFGQNNIKETYLVGYGQVWGFLKYFHPETSKQDWDRVLLDDYDELIACNSNQAFNEIISNLFEKCGSFEPKKRDIDGLLKFSESFDWLVSSALNSTNRSAIATLRFNKPRFKNKYISQVRYGNPKITNEKDYGAYTYDPSIQYLAITRYWNIINYFCPNRRIIPNNWTQVYYRNLQNFISAKNHEDYYFAVRKLTAEIRDGHGFILTENDPMDNHNYAPFDCLSFSDGYYITAVFQDSIQPIDLKRMDKIISINGEPVKERMQKIGAYLSTSNDYYLSKSTHYLRLENQDSITITVEREGRLIKKTYPTIERKTYERQSVKIQPKVTQEPYSFLIDSMSGKAYCYIHMGRLKKRDINRKFKRKLRTVDQIIIDCRNYPNWTILKLSRQLITGRTKFAKFIKMNFDYPGSYEWTKSQTIGNKKEGYDGNIYVLVDYNTMSLAEYTVMAFQQHPNTIVIGGQTAGANGNISGIPLPFGIKSVFSGLGVFYPDGTPGQQVGVKRDYEVVQSSRYLDGKDLILDKALDLIRSK